MMCFHLTAVKKNWPIISGDFDRELDVYINPVERRGFLMGIYEMKNVKCKTKTVKGP